MLLISIVVHMTIIGSLFGRAEAAVSFSNITVNMEHSLLPCFSLFMEMRSFLQLATA
jgi:hypothetical protein